jgi:geranylgeranyl reductase family protein
VNHFMGNFQYELAVVGGGPAGSAAALDAARRGISVVLYEKSPMPRAKPCGGAVSEQALSYLGFEIPRHLIDWECYGARVNFRTHVNTVSKTDRIAILVSREDFDAYLLDQARAGGAKVQQEKVTGIISHRDGLRIIVGGGEVSCRAAVIAQGATGNLIRMVRRSDTRNEVGVCAEFRFPVRASDRFTDLRGLVDIYFGINRFGYGWVFHHGKYYSVGVGGLSSCFPNPRDAFHGFCARLGFDSRSCTPNYHAIPCGGIRRTIIRDRMALAGDSAGFVDPFYGEGIAYAIRSGQLASETICRALNAGDLSARGLADYPRRCEEEFGRNLRNSLYLTRLMHQFPGVFLRLLSAERSVLEKYLDVPMKRLSYHSYIKWLLSRMPGFLLRSFLSPRS